MATTTMVSAFKRDVMLGAHCFMASQAAGTITGTTANGVFTVTAMSTVVGLAVGMAVAGTGIAAGTVIASIDSTTQITMSKAATGANAGTLAFGGDPLYVALIKTSPSGTYDASVTNYGTGSGTPTAANLGTDEVANGNGYVTGGQLLTNVTPTLDTGVAIVNFAPNPSWTSATFSTSAMEIYNKAARVGATAYAGGATNQTVSIHDLGSQTVTGGTFTILMPVAAAATAILRIA